MPGNADHTLVVPGRGRHLPDANPNPEIVSCAKQGRGFRRVTRRVRRSSAPHGEPAAFRGMTSWSGKTDAKHFFPILYWTISL